MAAHLLRARTKPVITLDCRWEYLDVFCQMFDSVSGTYSYLLASRSGGEALIIDPVLEKVDRYVQLLTELDLRLVKAVDTHLHADHVTASPSCGIARSASRLWESTQRLTWFLCGSKTATAYKLRA